VALAPKALIYKFYKSEDASKQEDGQRLPHIEVSHFITDNGPKGPKSSKNIILKKIKHNFSIISRSCNHLNPLLYIIHY
jgi:hypothetical protein